MFGIQFSHYRLNRAEIYTLAKGVRVSAFGFPVPCLNRSTSTGYILWYYPMLASWLLYQLVIYDRQLLFVERDRPFTIYHRQLSTFTPQSVLFALHSWNMFLNRSINQSIDQPIRNDTTPHHTTRHDTTRHDTTRHDTTQHSTAQHSNATQRNAIQYNTIAWSKPKAYSFMEKVHERNKPFLFFICEEERRG